MVRPRQAFLLAALGLLLAGPLLAGQAKPATAAPANKKDKDKEATKPGERVHLWADRVRYLHQQHRAIAKGSVTIIKGDMRIDCDEVEAHLQPGTSNFTRIIAKGNVRVHTVKPLAKRPDQRPKLQPVEGGRSATCQGAEHDTVKDELVLTGTPRQQPVVQIGSDRLRGDLITFDRKNDIVIVDGNTKITALVPESAGRASPKPGTATPSSKKPATRQPPR